MKIEGFLRQNTRLYSRNLEIYLYIAYIVNLYHHIQDGCMGFEEM